MPLTLKPPLIWPRKGLIKLIVGNLTNWTSDSGVFLGSRRRGKDGERLGYGTGKGSVKGWRRMMSKENGLKRE